MSLSPPALFVVCIALELLLDAVAPGARLLSPPWTLAGLLPLVGGVVLHARAWRLFREAGTPIDPAAPPERLVTRGPYRHTRNPMYLSGVLILGGLALLLGSATPPAGILLFGLVVRARYLPAEETALEERFGAEYEAYRDRVRRWI